MTILCSVKLETTKSSNFLKVVHSDNSSVKWTRRNDKLELIRDVF